MAAQIAVNRLDEVSDSFPVDIQNPEHLIETAMTTLGSKMYALVSVSYDIASHFAASIGATVSLPKSPSTQCSLLPTWTARTLTLSSSRCGSLLVGTGC